jgi:hypothetical protein
MVFPKLLLEEENLSRGTVKKTIIMSSAVRSLYVPGDLVPNLPNLPCFNYVEISSFLDLDVTPGRNSSTE